MTLLKKLVQSALASATAVFASKGASDGYEYIKKKYNTKEKKSKKDESSDEEDPIDSEFEDEDDDK